MTEARHRVHNISVRTVIGHRFVSDGHTVFTLADGMLVARVKQGSASVLVMEIVKKYLETANAQECVLIRRLIDDRLESVAGVI